MCVQTMYTDEWPSKGIPACSSMKWLMWGKFNMWFCPDNTGVWGDLLCPGAGWWRRATQRRMGLLWSSENLQATFRMQQNLSQDDGPCRRNKMVNHYISAPNTQKVINTKKVHIKEQVSITDTSLNFGSKLETWRKILLKEESRMLWQCVTTASSQWERCLR